MKNQIRLRILLAMMLVCLTGKSQTWEPVMPTITPPSPESAALEKFMGYPVSPATGLVDVSVPLYTINCYDLSIPIQLRYHSSGVKIHDPAGSAGRGWALTPGWKITRTVVGKPDERFPVKEGVTPNANTKEDEIRMAPNAGAGDCMTSNVTRPENADGQYDIFRIQLPAIEASFILKHVNGNPSIQMIPERPWKITPLIGPTQGNNPRTLYGFEVRDDKGIRYLFGDASLPSLPANAQYSEVSTGFANYFYVGWALREVIFPNQEKMTFTYDKREEYYPNFNHSITIVDNEQVIQYDDPYTPVGNIIIPKGSGYMVYDDTRQTYNTRYTSLVPKSIQTPGEIIRFTYTTYSTTNTMLTGMTVTNSSSQQIRNVVCTHNSTQKLLKSVSIDGSARYQFEYDQESNTQIDTGSFDWWGFYNGVNSRPEIAIPNLTLSVTPTIDNITQPAKTIQVGKGANRTPNNAAMTARALTKVTYPTGGTFKINYEPHSFKVGSASYSGAGLRVRSTESYDPQYGKTITKNYTYGEGKFTGRYYPNEKALVTSGTICQFGPNCIEARQRVLTVFPRQPYFNSSQIPVWYENVTETTDGGKTDYVYTHKTNTYTDGNTAHSSNYYYNDNLLTEDNQLLYPEPVLTRETLYERINGQDRLVKITENTYKADVNRMYTLSAIITRRKIGSDASNCHFLDKNRQQQAYYTIFGSPVESRQCWLNGGNYYLSSTKTTDYLLNGMVTHTVSYEYYTNQPYNLKSKTLQLADGNVMREDYYYSGDEFPDFTQMNPTERLASGTASMSNYKTLLWNQVNWVNEKKVSSVIHTYAPTVNGIFRPVTSSYKVGEGNYEKRVEFKHEPYGNLRHVQKDNNQQVFYIWGYKGRYPVASIQNATYAQITALISDAQLNSYAAQAVPSAEFLNKLAALKTQLPQASVTLLQYKPGVGVTQIESPRGIPSGFSYDTAGRLVKQTISDTNKTMTVQEYQYNYINK